ncbi:tRNA (N(6)-L-threonylcarbamoyladenosine(37)-C(2))-methylthiotransferase MtaB [Terrihabitans rhizophilus]|uniref:tRNA (N(6)-L-threonylcarbamoyladenosine(37)-C(2))-methylthiotransferase MtaB n=1 Tax=Terrihabitans rhizophilus TaxID=3092662 RepID=A0ABU4RMM1_9HYPH|nr:tRNA (N(6)-L-threonylcarbamoyladenosine(37)-C(2))-methylthiotransferase MtaB [Terrihabitans sp. PJ23]MDX6806077.1 tRNA (N(6)-L-threonylcarbamoyladenosine(37)-C(2))-methylthiotransferase MtaB [Terrihabitans sp. PJ23]
MSVEVVTFGCRLNMNESEAIRRAAEEAGRENLIVVNTCAVTAEAGRQARQAIRRLRRLNPHSEIVVTGCAAQTEPQTYAAMPEVSGVLGNAAKAESRTWEQPFGLDAVERVRVDDIMSVRETALHLIDGWGGRPRAFVQVQNGCDHRCTFCIIPYGRGPSRSVPMGAVVEQVRHIARNGCAELVLTGVDLTSYGADLPGGPALGTLVRTILRLVPELPRLRISSIDAVEADDDLLAAFAEEERLMPHLHLSLQAGDDLVLKRMKRRHLRADAIAFCAKLRRLRPGMVFGADFITGFPTESYAAFRRTLDLVEECGLTHLHVFPFSARPGTPAARMPQLPTELARERAARLRIRGSEALHRHLAGEIGQRRRVLAENPNTGRTEGFAVVKLARPVETGSLIPITIAGHDGAHLLAA